MLASLRIKCEDIRILKFKWSNSLISKFRWESHERDAVRFSNSYTNNPVTHECTFLPLRTQSAIKFDNSSSGDEEDDSNEMRFTRDSTQTSAELLAELVSDDNDIQDEDTSATMTLNGEEEAINTMDSLRIHNGEDSNEEAKVRVCY